MKKQNKKEEDWDFEAEEKDSQLILEILELFIKKNFGERCKTKAVGCEACKIWQIYDLLRLFLW